MTVHNHGTEGPLFGLECPEYVINGQLTGRCLLIENYGNVDSVDMLKLIEAGEA